MEWAELCAPAREVAASPAHSRGYAAAACWAKLFLHEMLPPGVERALYLDADVIALASLAPLLGSSGDPQARLLAAARDMGEPCGHAALAAAGWKAGDPYFNAGVLVLDVGQLRARAGEARRILAAPSATAALRFHDQDVLNLLCRGGAWQPLPLAWNAQGLGSYAAFRTAAEARRPALLSPAELRALEARPRVVHFTGPPTVLPSDFLNPHVGGARRLRASAVGAPAASRLLPLTALRLPWQPRSRPAPLAASAAAAPQVPFSSKPWAYLCAHPLRAAFFDLLDSTPWAGWRPGQQEVADAIVCDVLRFLQKISAQRPEFDAARCLDACCAALGRHAKEGAAALAGLERLPH